VLKSSGIGLSHPRNVEHRTHVDSRYSCKRGDRILHRSGHEHRLQNVQNLREEPGRELRQGLASVRYLRVRRASRSSRASRRVRCMVLRWRRLPDCGTRSDTCLAINVFAANHARELVSLDERDRYGKRPRRRKPTRLYQFPEKHRDTGLCLRMIPEKSIDASSFGR